MYQNLVCLCNTLEKYIARLASDNVEVMVSIELPTVNKTFNDIYITPKAHAGSV